MAQPQTLPDVKPQPKSRGKTRLVSLRLQEPIGRSLDEYCKRGNFSISSVIESALVEFLRKAEAR